LKRANRKIRKGIVTSDKMAKTVVVLIERHVRHPLYQKVIKRTKKFKAHDENEICSVGDRVEIMEVRPMSSGKRWIVLQVLGKKKEIIEEEDKGMPAPVRRARAEEKQIDTKQV
jgi:small subunit ribosomal protein S17